jgi:Zn-dependent peptidase ImmA (M78 family)/DNA-binding XRE family transcriptional regulator
MLKRHEPPIKDPHIAALRFQPTQLMRARELRGLTKASLAERIDKTASAISQFESGQIRPDPETVGRLAMALGLPVAFFAKDAPSSQLSLEDCHFRSLRSTSQYVRRQSIRTAELIDELLIELEAEGVVLPKPDLEGLKRPAMSPDDIEELAVEVRKAWGLGLGPIHDPIPLLESVGIRFLPLASEHAEVDAFSFWKSGKPYIVPAMQKASSRTHFDVAHELGHLLIHEDVSPGNPELEGEADLFASAFLLPRETFLRECPTRWTLATFRALKRRWRVSIQGLTVRAHRLGRLSESSYRRAFMRMNQLKIRRAEPDEWVLDRPMVIPEALRLIQDTLPLATVSERLGLSERNLRDLLEPLRDPGEVAGNA